MAETATKLPVKNENPVAQPASPRTWHPFESLRREIDHLFDDFSGGVFGSPLRRARFDLDPLWRRELSWVNTPAVDVVESEKAYEITAELPGMDEKNIDVKVANGILTIKGEKREEKEEKEKDYYLQERRFGSFERRFQLPEGVDADKIEANFEKGVLKVTLPKSVEAKKSEKKIAVKAA